MSFFFGTKGANNNAEIPVIMYHSVSDDQRWLWGHLSCPVDVFEDQMCALACGGFKTITLQDLYSHFAHRTSLPDNPVVLTFDDGYLDTWVNVYPILERYGLRGTVFVNPEFVDPRDFCHRNLNNVWKGQAERSVSKVRGYVSWPELAVMDRSGVLDVQSHALTHTWYFCDDAIIDFHRPGDGYPWLGWNARPERKYLWLDEDQSDFVPYGFPVYTHGKSLIVKRFLPDARFSEFMAKQVENRGGAEFFGREGWSEMLQALAGEYRSHHELRGFWESDEEYQDRVRHELSASKEILESKLRKTVSFVCWPGGGYNSLTERTAMQVGHRSMLYAPGKLAQPRQDAMHTPRWGVPTLGRRGTNALYCNGRYLVHALRCRQGRVFSCLVRKLLSRYHAARFSLSRKGQQVRARRAMDGTRSRIDRG
jgi:peptidoglycan/xylan/chitin deacetylase (PgdA/CDA1 family)